MKRLIPLAAAWLGLAGAQLGGCVPGADDLFPIATLVVVNNPDSFTVSMVGVQHSETVNQNWSCSAAQANITFAQTMLQGSVRILILDNAGAAVYDNTHGPAAGGIQVQTRPGGAPGTWNVTVDASGATWTGAISITADTPPTADAITLGSGQSSGGTWTFYVDWTAGPAQVGVGTGIGTGSLRIRLWDSAAVPVYDRTISSVTGAVSEPTAAGAAGTWTIQIDFSGMAAGSAVTLTD